MAERGEPLSERELAVLSCLASGSTNREIALELEISPNTVKVHLRNIFTKLGVSSRTEATTVAIQKGLLTLPGAEGGSFEPGPQQTPAVTPEEPPLAESLLSPKTEQQPAPQWRWIAFLLVLAVALLIGAIVGALLMGDEPTDTAGNTPIPTAEVFIADPMEDSNWFVDRPMPRERANMALASIGLDLYLIGGEVDAGVINLVDVFETDSHQWHSASSKPTAVADVTGDVLFGEIFVPGGRLADGRPTAVVEAYSPANNAWRPVAPLPGPVAGGLALSNGDFLYSIGGWDGDRALTTAFVYDPEEDSWQELPEMQYARSDAAGGVMDGRLFVVGGWDGEQEVAVCEYFDPAASSWAECPPMSLPRAGAGATVLGSNQLYVIGGGLQGEVPYAEVYDANAEQWKQIEMPMLENAPAWSHLGVTSVETRVYALGGRQGETIQLGNYVYEPFKHRTFLPTVGGDG